MKGLLIPLCGLLVLQSCEKFTVNRYYRAQVLRNDARSRDTVEGSDFTLPKGDTILYVSAVTVPDDYDWRKDSLYGGASCELQLLRNGIPVASMRTGSMASSSPDTHHIMGGHLYTEYVTADGTLICRDGAELFRYSQAERLKGLLVKGEDIYSIGKDMDGDGFTFRRNGTPLLHQDNGTPFGDFSNPAYGRNGALYESGGSVCFCFKTQSACYSVVDGTMNQIKTGVSAQRIMDMRFYGDCAYYAADYTTSTMVFMPDRTIALPSGQRWLSVGLFPHDGAIWAIADSNTSTIVAPASQLDNASGGVKFVGNGNFIYEGNNRFFSIACDEGAFSIRDDVGRILYVRDSTFFFGRNSVDCMGDHVYALVNPRERGQAPSVWQDGKEKEYPVNGYLTALDVEISLPRISHGSHPGEP